jgi:hypothetical protein
MSSLVAVRWWSLVLSLVVAAWCVNTEAQPLQASTVTRGLGLSGPSVAQAILNEVKQAEARTTCRLTIEGGSNATELSVLGTSIARAELTCTGEMIQIAVHPVLAPFSHNFKGVNVTSTPSLQELQLAEAMGATKGKKCFSTSITFIRLCGEPIVRFSHFRIVNVRSYAMELILADKETSEEAAAAMFVQMLSTDGGAITLIEPLMSGIQFFALSISGLLYVQGGLINGTMGILGRRGMLFEGTRFTNNQGLVFAGAVTVMAGHAIFKDCMFRANLARTLDESTRGASTVFTYRSGAGGAVLGQLTSRGNKTMPLQTSVTFVNCAFTNNKAHEGGAIAMAGVNTTITNCTFTGNSAIQNGFDVFSTQGGALDIVGSNIAVTSPTVAWERVDAGQCLRGEYFGKLEGTCRRCPGSTYSLVIPVPAECLSCPPNAKVGLRA